MVLRARRVCGRVSTENRPIKGQALADFVAKFACTPPTDEDKEDKENDHDGLTKKRTNDPIGPVWDLHVDGASNTDRDKLRCVL